MMREEDKRNFRRYQSRSECEVITSMATYRGVIIDYSDGAGIELEGTADIRQGEEIDIRATDHDTAFRGAVAWIRTVDNRLRIGVRRITALKGNLKHYRFPDVLIGINRSAWTGVLKMRRGATVRNIFIDKGDMIFAVSNEKDDRLGERLVKKGKITLIQYENASHLLMKTGKKLGKILVELCYLSPSELYQAVRQQIEEIIVSHFQWEEGEFEFKEGPFQSDEVITLQISAANIIYRGMKKIDNFDLIKQMCPSANDILNPSRNPVMIFQSLSIDETDKKILSYVNGIYPLKTILSLSPSQNFETLKTLSAFMSIGLIYVKGERDEPMTLPIEEIFREPQEIAPQEFLEKIQEVHNKCDTGGYYEALGIAENASLEEIEKAYFQLLKQFHPDRHFSFPSLDIKDKLLKIISYTTKGYEILSDPKKRQEYNKTNMLSDPSGTASRDQRSAPCQDIQGMETESLSKEDRMELIINNEVPTDVASSGSGSETVETVSGEEVYTCEPNHETVCQGNGGYEASDHAEVHQYDAQNTQDRGIPEGNGCNGTHGSDLPDHVVSSGAEETPALIAETPMGESMTTSAPEWVRDSEFRTPEENALYNEIAGISKKISELQNERKGLEQRIETAGSVRALLYEQGKELEHAVRDALVVLGFSVKPVAEGEPESAIFFESPEGRCLGNIEGKDDTAISIDTFNKLEQNLQQDFTREDVADYAKGVLFGNAERLRPLRDRSHAFTPKCVTAARRVHAAMVRTADLFEPVSFLRMNPDPDYARMCREAIFKAEGETVTFPPVMVRQ